MSRTRPIKDRPVTAEARDHFRRRLWLSIVGIAIVLLAGAGVVAYSFRAGAPNLAAKELREGMTAMAPGHYQEAVERFDRVLQIDPETRGVYLQRGLAYQNLGHADRALEDLERAAAEEPGQAAVYTALGTLYHGKGDRQKALEQFAKALRIREDPNTFYERARLYDELGKYKEAVEDLDKVVEILRDAPHALRLRALMKRKLGDAAGAQADIAQADEFERRSRDGTRRR